MSEMPEDEGEEQYEDGEEKGEFEVKRLVKTRRKSSAQTKNWNKMAKRRGICRKLR
jgi:hypothetical protein